jgi:hypothetical protein
LLGMNTLPVPFQENDYIRFTLPPYGYNVIEF